MPLPWRDGNARRPRPEAVLALLLTINGVAQIWLLAQHSPAIDYYQFWVVSQVAGRADVHDVYGDVDRARIGREFQERAFTDDTSALRRAAAQLWPTLTPLGTPFLYATFHPLVRGAYDDDLRRHRIVSLAALGLGVLLLGRLLRLSPTTVLIVLAALTQAFEPLRSDVRVGNVNQLQVGMLAVYLWLGRGPDRSGFQVAAGTALALAVWFKPNVAAIVPLVLLSAALERRWDRLARQGAGMLGGTLLAVGTGAFLFGTLRAWRDWLRIVTTLPPEIGQLGAGNFGPARILYERLGIAASPYLAVVAMAAAVACLWRGSSGRGDTPAPPEAGAARDVAIVGAGCLVYLLSAPVVWLHYLLLALPAALAVLSTSRAGIDGVASRILAGLAWAAIAVDPAVDLAGMRDLPQQATLAAAGLLLLFVLTLREIARRPPPSPPIEAATAYNQAPSTP